MRHQKNGKTFSRESGSRRAFYRGLVTNFLLRGKIKTTSARAKTIRGLIEKCITLARKDNLIVRRRLLAYIYDERAEQKLLEVYGPKYATRPGGYTRIVKLGTRVGDAAPEVILELV
jgi:large subunit ribosomal protein L17